MEPTLFLIGPDFREHQCRSASSAVHRSGLRIFLDGQVHLKQSNAERAERRGNPRTAELSTEPIRAHQRPSASSAVHLPSLRTFLDGQIHMKQSNAEERVSWINLRIDSNKLFNKIEVLAQNSTKAPPRYRLLSDS